MPCGRCSNPCPGPAKDPPRSCHFGVTHKRVATRRTIPPLAVSAKRLGLALSGALPLRAMVALSDLLRVFEQKENPPAVAATEGLYEDLKSKLKVCGFSSRLPTFPNYLYLLTDGALCQVMTAAQRAYLCVFLVSSRVPRLSIVPWFCEAF